jgi:hypothetical protein
MISNMTLIEAIHAEVQELEAEYSIREKDILTILDLVEELRERFEQDE